MLHLAPGIFGCRARVIITALISACRTMQSAGHGRQVLLPTALIIIPLILQAPIVLTITLLILPAHTAPTPTALTVMPALAQTIWQVCSVPAVITCTMIPLAGPFNATAR